MRFPRTRNMRSGIDGDIYLIRAVSRDFPDMRRPKMSAVELLEARRRAVDQHLGRVGRGLSGRNGRTSTTRTGVTP